MRRWRGASCKWELWRKAQPRFAGAPVYAVAILALILHGDKSPITYNMQAFRSTARVASQFRPAGLPRFVRGYASAPQYEHIMVSTPKPGVGFSQSSSYSHELRV
jgi:hypothetical protein